MLAFILFKVILKLKRFIFTFTARKEIAVKKLREDKSKLEGEVEQLERKVERMSTMAKQVTTQHMY